MYKLFYKHFAKVNRYYDVRILRITDYSVSNNLCQIISSINKRKYNNSNNRKCHNSTTNGINVYDESKFGGCLGDSIKVKSHLNLLKYF